MSYRRIVFSSLIGLSGLLFVSCSNSTGLEDPDSLRGRIGNLKGVTVVELVPYYNYDREFLLDIEQPIDHQDSSAGTFTQRAYLLHNDESSPMVLASGGFAAYADDLHEMTQAFDANQISMTHRYFSGAIPGSDDYQYLTMEQAAGDYHRIVELFKEIYPESWLSSGFGKGGLAALSHRRFYPDDVEATIAYSTPFLNSQTDSRPMEYIKSLGEIGTYDNIKMFQEALLKRRAEILPYIYYFMNYTAYNYYYTWSMNVDLILELAVMDYPFDYWSYHDEDLIEIPDTSESAETLFDHFYQVVTLDYFSDDYVNYLSPSVYQSMTELGAVAYDSDHIKDLLTVVDLDSSVNFNYECLAPADIEMVYNSNALTDLQNWLISDGNNIVYLYGELDPIISTAIDLSGGATNAIKLIQAGEDHYIGIAAFDEADQVYNALRDWMGFEIEPLFKTATPGKME
ncbi:MAG: hypothetical protein JXR87_06085, partial [Candidatus Marinimicrobia bacterium]|nr:hypothetical protein [Candidatus Neomarinimicrobiota bacterium]